MLSVNDDALILRLGDGEGGWVWLVKDDESIAEVFVVKFEPSPLVVEIVEGF